MRDCSLYGRLELPGILELSGLIRQPHFPVPVRFRYQHFSIHDAFHSMSKDQGKLNRPYATKHPAALPYPQPLILHSILHLRCHLSVLETHYEVCHPFLTIR
jgi:hypothetical protein